MHHRVNLSRTLKSGNTQVDREHLVASLCLHICTCGADHFYANSDDNYVHLGTKGPGDDFLLPAIMCILCITQKLSLVLNGMLQECFARNAKSRLPSLVSMRLVAVPFLRCAAGEGQYEGRGRGCGGLACLESVLCRKRAYARMIRSSTHPFRVRFGEAPLQNRKGIRSGLLTLEVPS